MASQEKYTVEQSGAFVDTFEIAPTAEGPLSGLTFAVKDLIDIGGQKTGCGNPSCAIRIRRREEMPPASINCSVPAADSSAKPFPTSWRSA